MAVLAIMLVMPFGFATPAQAVNKADFSFFDNTTTANEGIQCTAREEFEYHISASEWAGVANVLRVTYADGDFTRFKVAANGTLQLSGFARGGNTNQNQNFPDRCITICAETASSLAGQMSVKTDTSSQPPIKCNNVTCDAGGVAPACPPEAGSAS
jgi:hypothetical protein